MSNLRYNLNNNHPLIPSNESYLYEKKYVSINSEDRDILKYPNPAVFEIELPQDYVNVQSVKLSSWSFPSNYNVFSYAAGNLTFVFTMKNIYNPSDHGVSDPLLQVIYIALSENPKHNYLLDVEEGFYNPSQMATELTNKMNLAVTNHILSFFHLHPEYATEAALFQGYSEFVVAYNSVVQKLYFGNKSSGFDFPNDNIVYQEIEVVRRAECRINPAELPSFSNWGLPAYLGFVRCPALSIKSNNVNDYRFYYGTALTPGDKGVWIKPSYPGASVYFLQAPLKINFMGPSYIYMELDDGNISLNCIDETSPYNLSRFTQTTNQTNGVVNSCFAKIPVPTTPLSQWYDNDMVPYKWFDPPAERIRRLRIKMRYHNGSFVDFGLFAWSIMIEFAVLNPQIPKKMQLTKY